MQCPHNSQKQTPWLQCSAIYPLDASSVCSCVSAAPQGYVFYACLRFELNENRASVWRGWHAACIQRIFSKMALHRHRGDKLLNKVVFFVFFAQKRCSRRFIKFRLNHWWQIDYSDNAFHTFMGLDSAIYYAVNGTVTSLPVFIQNILICVPKTNKAFTSLERHGGK